jgi:hypothetical protein
MRHKFLVIALVISAFLFGRFTNINSDTVDMNKVVNIQANEYGAHITLLGGNGYYWER